MRAVTNQPKKEKALGKSWQHVEEPGMKEKERAKPFPITLSDITRHRGHKLKYRKYHLNGR